MLARPYSHAHSFKLNIRHSRKHPSTTKGVGVFLAKGEPMKDALLTPLLFVAITLWSIALIMILFIKMLIWEIPTCAKKTSRQ